MLTSEFIITGMFPIEKYQRKDLTEGLCQIITVVNKYDGDISLTTKLYAPFVPNQLHVGDEIRLTYRAKNYIGKQTGIPMTYIIAHDVVPVRTSAPIPFVSIMNSNNEESSNNENDNLVPQAYNNTTTTPNKNNNE